MKNQVCILTDSSAQFTNPVYPGQELVHIIPFGVKMYGKLVPAEKIHLSQLPRTLNNGFSPQLTSPSMEDFRNIFSQLTGSYNEIIVLLQSSQLSQAVTHAQQAAKFYNGYKSIQIVDSQTTAVGLGLLVQQAAQASSQGAQSVEIVRLLSGLLPRLYTVFFVQGLTYLQHAGHLDHAQAILGEMLGVTPFLLLEGGRLIPIQKVRNMRHLVDTIHEFLSEFNTLEHIAIIQGYPAFEHEGRILHERISSDYPDTPFSEHTLNPPLATLLGPRSLGLVVME